MAERPEFERFDTTRWSLVSRARTDAKSLGVLLERYYVPLRTHLVLRRRLNPDRAEDLLQGFIADKILERDFISHADQSKGRFRSLLLRSLDNYVIDQVRRQPASANRPVSYDPERHSHLKAADDRSADVFDVAWARQVLAEALRKMRAECLERNRLQAWNIFEGRILRPIFMHAPPVSYDELSAQYGFVSPEQASNALVTTKRHFQRAVHDVIAEYVANDGEVAEEINALRTILEAAVLRGEAIRGDEALDALDLDRASPELLATMLDLDAGRDSLWRQDELGSVLRHFLSLPIGGALPKLHADLTVRADMRTSPPDEPIATLDDLFQHARPPLALLEAVKGATRDAARADASAVSTDIYTVVYFGAIAAALARHGQRISKSDNQVLRYGFRLVLDRPWVSDPILAVIRQGVAALRSKGDRGR